MRSTVGIVAICSLSLSGCGTFSDAICGPITAVYEVDPAGVKVAKVKDHIFYRGVRLDVQAVKEGGPMTLMAADIPFSAVADTLLVPYLAYQMHKCLQDETQEREKANETKTDTLPQVKPNE